ncbi:MAG: triose-phosphate isomerase [Deltaproteobacteria bacterium]|nr:triose-phosphate isomerase [Deltaproteobacteria bacterium]
MRRAMLAGNWKMFKNAREVDAFADDFIPLIETVHDRDILICPACIYIQRLIEAFRESPAKVGAQNVYWEDAGAYTGEISAPMLKSIGAQYAIIGHSERREYFNETNASVNKKILAVLKHGLNPIVCIGETLEERESQKAFDVIGLQIREGLTGLGIDLLQEIVIAYEPVWAIGTGKTATPDIAQEVHHYIRDVLAELFDNEYAQTIRILYGGSVKPENIDILMAQPDIDGALVGGASLDTKTFERIVKFQ